MFRLQYCVCLVSLCSVGRLKVNGVVSAGVWMRKACQWLHNRNKRVAWVVELHGAWIKSSWPTWDQDEGTPHRAWRNSTACLTFHSPSARKLHQWEAASIVRCNLCFCALYWTYCRRIDPLTFANSIQTPIISYLYYHVKSSSQVSHSKSTYLALDH